MRCACRYVEFLSALSPMLVLLVHEKQRQGVELQGCGALGALEAVCSVAMRVFPGVSDLRQALVAHPAAVACHERCVLPHEPFAAALSGLLQDASGGGVAEGRGCSLAAGGSMHVCEGVSGADVAAVARVCRAVGRNAVAVDDLEQLCCIVLERTLRRLLDSAG